MQKFPYNLYIIQEGFHFLVYINWLKVSSIECYRSMLCALKQLPDRFKLCWLAWSFVLKDHTYSSVATFQSCDSKEISKDKIKRFASGGCFFSPVAQICTNKVIKLMFFQKYRRKSCMLIQSPMFVMNLRLITSGLALQLKLNTS